MDVELSACPVCRSCCTRDEREFRVELRPYGLGSLGYGLKKTPSKAQL